MEPYNYEIVEGKVYCRYHDMFCEYNKHLDQGVVINFACPMGHYYNIPVENVPIS